MLLDNKKILGDLFRDDPETIADYLTEIFEKNDFDATRRALSLTVQAQNVQILGRDAGILRNTLYRTFGGKVDPHLSRILKLFDALHVHFQVASSVGRNLAPQQGSAAATNKKGSALTLRDDPKLIASYLTQAFEGNDIETALFALREVTRAQNVSALARAAGIPRRTLYKSFGGAT
jgi:probable addiction module antidote protein